MISACIGCCGTISRCPEKARALTQGRYALLKSMPGLGPVCGAGHGAAARRHAPWHGRLLVREGHNHGDHRAPRDDHCAAVDGCGVGAPTHPDHGQTYRVGVACPGGSTAGATTLPLLRTGDHWGGARTTPDTRQCLVWALRHAWWPASRGLLPCLSRSDTLARRSSKSNVPSTR